MIEGCFNILICFSKDGSLFAYFNMDSHELKIYEVEDNIEQLIEKIRNGVSHLIEYQEEHDFEDDDKPNNINEIVFDDDNRFVIIKS